MASILGSPTTVLGRFATGSTTATLKPDIDSVLVDIMAENAPEILLFTKLAHEQAEGRKFEWFEEPEAPKEMVVNGAHDAAETDITVDAVYAVGGDLILVESTREIIRVDLVSDSTSLSTVVRGQEGTTAAPIPDNAVLINIGSALSEGSNTPAMWGTVPTNFYNYLQKARTAVGATYDQIMQIDWTKGTGLADKMRAAMKRHVRGIAQSFYWGRRTSTTYNQSTGNIGGMGSNTAAVLTMTGGLEWAIDDQAETERKVNFGGSLSRTDFLDDFAYVLVDRAANPTIFAPSKLLQGMGEWKYGKFEVRNDETTLNLNVTAWTLPEGGGKTINIIHQKDLNKPKVGNPVKGNWVVGLDMSPKAIPRFMTRHETSTEDVILANSAKKPQGEEKEFFTEYGFKIMNVNNHIIGYGLEECVA